MSGPAGHPRPQPETPVQLTCGGMLTALRYLAGLTFLLFKWCVHIFGVAIYEHAYVSVTMLIKDTNTLPLSKDENSFHRSPSRQHHSLANPFHLQIST